MEWPVTASSNADLEIPAANHPQIRFVRVKGPGSQTPVEDFDGGWQVCSPESVNGFSAVGYFFGRELQQQLDVPIGLIDNSWGGSACEAWIRRDRLEGNPLYADAACELGQDRRRVREGAKIRTSAEISSSGNHRPANLYHARLGARSGLRDSRRDLVPGRIERRPRVSISRNVSAHDPKSWREDWEQGDFPFYWVQLADFMAEKPEPGDSAWAELREAQTMTQDRLPNTGQAVIIDIGEGVRHSSAEQARSRPSGWPAGLCARLRPRHRLPKPALRVDEKRGRHDRAEVQGRRRRSAYGRRDQRCRALRLPARIASGSGPRRRLSAPIRSPCRASAVPKPVAVRYAWADNPVCNLYNKVGLPVTPFRTDDWPGVTVDAR